MVEETGSPQRAALIYNPIKVDQAKLRELVTTLSAEYGWGEPMFFETRIDDLGDGVAGEALAAGADAVLVAGGDGTVRAVAQAMTGSDVPLTIVPSGTGNLLARNLNLPLTVPEKMIRATFAGDRLPVDVGIATITRAGGDVEEHGFVVMAGIGLDAAMIANTNPDLKKRMGWVAYVDGAARSLQQAAEPFRVIYQMAGRRMHTTKVQSVLFANCGALPAGITLIPDASITDGMMDVVIIQPTGWFGWLGVFRNLWDNSVLRRSKAGRFITEVRGRDNSVRFARGAGCETATEQPQAVELDGDEFGEAVRVSCRIVPGGVTMAVPQGHPTAKL